MRWDGFGRSVVFAAAAGAAWPAFALVVGPLLGARAALSLYGVGVATLYVAGLGPERTRAVAAALFVGAVGAVLAAAGSGPGGIALGTAAALGASRSVLLHRARPARGLATEACLLGAGLGLARFLAGPGTLGVSLAIWGFLLVQSAYFLVGGVRARRSGSQGLDRFERARARALALLEEAGG